MMKIANSRLRLWSGIGLLAGAILLAPQAAFASTGHSATAATTAVKTVSQPQASAWIHPDSSTTTPVYPRLSLPGCSRQDGFNGNVEVTSGIPPFYDISIWGEVWDVCGTEAQVYLSWTPGSNNYNVGSSQYNHTNGVNWGPRVTSQPLTAQVTVCANWATKWYCGQPYSTSPIV